MGSIKKYDLDGIPITKIMGRKFYGCYRHKEIFCDNWKDYKMHLKLDHPEYRPLSRHFNEQDRDGD